MALATTSDWRNAAVLAGACILCAVLIIPMLLGGRASMQGVASVFTMFAWLLGVTFGAISLFRFIQKRRSDK